MDLSDASQASQLLAAALCPKVSQPAAPAFTPSGVSQQDNPHLPSNHSAHYLMHDLGITQSVYGSEERPSMQGSQKVNIVTSPEKGEHSLPSSPAHAHAQSVPFYTASENQNSRERCQKDNALASGDKGEPSLPSSPRVQPLPCYTSGVCDSPSTVPLLIEVTKGHPCPEDTKDLSCPRPVRITSVASPPPPHLQPLHSMPPPPLPPPSPQPHSLPSQDSFTGPLPVSESVKAFLATDKNFNVSLSQVGEVTQSTAEEDPPVQSYPMPRQPPKVLVTNTPSSSSQSQSQSNARRSQSQQSDTQYGHSQYSDLFPQAQTEDYSDPPTFNDDILRSPSQPTSTPSSSLERLLANPFEHAPAATQCVDSTPPTQIATQIDSQTRDYDSVFRGHNYFNENSQMIFPSVQSKSRSTDKSRSVLPRGLLGLIAPEKRYRYLASDVAGPSRSPMATHEEWVATQPLSECALEETQPSDVAVNGSLTPLDTRRRLPPVNRVLKAGQSLHTTARAPPPAEESVEPDETGPTEIVTQSLDNHDPPTQAPSPSPDMTGPTELVTQSLYKSSPTKFVPDSDPPEVPLRMRRRPGSASFAATYHSPEMESRPRQFSEDEVLPTVVKTISTAPPVAEEEEEEEEEEIPLAKMKGMPRAGDREAKAATRGRRRGMAPPSPVRTTITRTNQQGSSWKGVIVPSSDPGERHEEIAPKSKPVKPCTPVPALPKSRATRAAKTAAQGRLAESSDEADQDVGTSDDETVPADDDDMDVDPPSARPARGSKRKRTVPNSAPKARANARTVIKAELSTPVGRPAKRIKIEPGSDSSTRVFALWKGTAQYYSGVVYESQGAGSGRFVVKFDDNDNAELELRHLRACRLKVGDHVLRQKDKAVVVACSPCPDSGYLPEDTVTLELKDDGREVVEVQSLQIPIRSVNAEWNDRRLTEDAVIPIVRPKVSPTPSRRSVSMSVQSDAQRKKALAGIGLVVSVAPSKEAQDLRTGIVADIKKRGGVVLEDWTVIFGMEGALEQKGLRWVLRQTDISWKEKAGQGIDKVFLISDEFHQKSKYLVALALGIPCLSMDWLKSYGETETHWRPHMLPAGYSEQLEARVSQMIDIDWGTSDHHLTDVAANKVAPKVFAEMSILCISSDYVPVKKAKKGGDSAKEAAQSVPRIILCMGAEVVESVADAKHASRDPKSYDYVVVPDQDLSRFAKYRNAVDVNWVKDCLISGRLLPMPGD